MRLTLTFSAAAACLVAAGAQAQTTPGLFNVSHDTYACQNPRATLALTNPAEPRRMDPGWVAYVVNDGHCAPVTPRSPWNLVSRDGELAYMSYAGTTGLPGSFYFRSADLVQLPAAAAVQASPAATQQPAAQTLGLLASEPTAVGVQHPSPMPAPSQDGGMDSSSSTQAPGQVPGRFAKPLSGYIDPPEARVRQSLPAPLPHLMPESGPQSTGPAAPSQPSLEQSQQLPTTGNGGSTGGTAVFTLAVLGLLGFVSSRRLKMKATRNRAQARVEPTRSDPISRRSDVVQSGRPVPEPLVRPVSSAPVAPACGAVAVWQAQKMPVTIRGHLIRGGFIYVGAVHPSAPAGSPCFIDPAMGVAAKAPETSGQGMPYWPSYATLTPRCRLAYLEWLAGDRSGRSAYIGYVFLYFYGLERRLFVDGTTAPESAAIVREVERLRAIHGSNRSFAGYSQRLLDAVDIKRCVADPSQLEGYMPALDGPPHDLPVLARLAIASRVARGEPIPFELVAAWVLGLPQDSLPLDPRVFRHARPHFLQLLRSRFDEACPMGLRLSPGKGRALDLHYKGATAGLLVDLASSGANAAWSDPAGLNWKAVTGMAVAAGEELEAYAKRIAARPGWATTVEALSLLPRSLGRAWGREAAAWLGGLPTPLATMSYAEVAERVLGESDTRCTPRRLEKVEEALAAVGFGIEPHGPLASGSQVASMVVFADVTVGVPRSQRYCMAELGAELLSATARLNPATVGSVERAWMGDIVARLRLTPAEELRLAARLRWLAESPVSVSRIRKGLAETDRSDQALAATSVAMAVAGKGHVAREQVAILEQVYDELQLPRADLYSKIHGAMFDAGSTTSTENVPASVEPVTPAAGTFATQCPAPLQPDPQPKQSDQAPKPVGSPRPVGLTPRHELPLVARGTGEIVHAIPPPPEPVNKKPGHDGAQPGEVTAPELPPNAVPERARALDEARLARLRVEADQVSALLAGVGGQEGASAAAAPTTIAPTPPSTVSPSPLPRAVFDEERLTRIRAETERVSTVLAGVFQAEEARVPAATVPPARSATGDLPGLGSAHSGLVRLLRERPEWPRSDFGAAARSVGLLPDGALEAVNEWAYDHLGGPLIEEGEPMTVDLDLLASDPEIADAA